MLANPNELRLPGDGQEGAVLGLDGKPILRGQVGSFVERCVNHEPNKPISFQFRPWLRRIYESEHLTQRYKGELLRPKRRTILKTARQCEKSTSLGNKIATFTAVIKNCTSLFVSSSEKQASEFGSERINNVLRVSPKLRASLGRAIEDNKFTKRFSNNSRVLIRSVNFDRPPDTVRGIPADIVLIDEIQSVNPDHIPVITSCANNSHLPGGPMFLFAGTPLTSDNFITQAFQRNSTQNHWLTKCEACNHWSPPFQKTVSRKGMICEKCGRAINPLRGEWVSMRVGDLRHIPMEGYHMSRVMMPYTRIAKPSSFEDSWASFYADFTNPTYSEGKIANELFGLEHDSGRKPITRETLLKMCHPDVTMRRVVPDRVLFDPDWPVFMGVDWGEGSGDGAYTVVTIAYPGIVDGETKTIVSYMKRYEGGESDPSFVKQDLVDLFTENDCALAMVDAGHGWGMIDHLWDKIPGGRLKVIPMQYTGQGAILHYDKVSGYMKANRTRWMARVFSMMNRQRFILPRWDQFETPFADDMLNIFVDRSDSLRQSVYKHSGTDDSFHSVLYAQTALLYYKRELDEFLNA